MSGLLGSKARNYIDILQTLLSENDEINKGEADGEDLSDFQDSTIQSKLRNKIYDSSLTIVVVSKGMKELYTPEKDQWIPWEISYSLKEHTRNGRTSQTNAVLAVVLPDRFGDYDYFIENKFCQDCSCRLLKTNILFNILKNNMFNLDRPQYKDCDEGDTIYLGECSYIKAVKWTDFKTNVNFYLDTAYKINENIDDYSITKSLI